MFEAAQCVSDKHCWLVFLSVTELVSTTTSVGSHCSENHLLRRKVKDRECACVRVCLGVRMDAWVGGVCRQITLTITAFYFKGINFVLLFYYTCTIIFSCI